jgi:cyanophycin synthetase
VSWPGLRLRARQLDLRVRRKLSRLLGLERTVYVDQRLDEYRGYWSAAAKLLGARFESLTDTIWQIELDGRVARVSGHMVSLDDPVTLRLAGDKPYGHVIARGLRLPTPDHMVFATVASRELQAVVAADRGPWVIKPAASSSSALGVTTVITNTQQVPSAVALASLYSDRVMLERMIPGETCRLLFLDGELISAVRRRGARVMADGKGTVRDIVVATGLGRILRDPMCLPTLASQGLDLGSVPASGRSVLLRGTGKVEQRNTELRTIYDECITGLVHPDTASCLSKLVSRLGSRFAGVDIITVDPAIPLAENNGAFLEVNTTPGIHHHYQSSEDYQDHAVAVAVVQAMLGIQADEIAVGVRLKPRKGMRQCSPLMTHV